MTYRINPNEPDKFEKVSAGKSNDYVEFKFENNILRIEWIQSQVDNSGVGTALVLNLINYLGAVPDKIYGHLSTTQAHLESGWKHSIPFYCKLGLKIQEKYNLSGYEFHLYDDIERNNTVFSAANGEVISNEFVDEYIRRHTQGINYDGLFDIVFRDR